MKIYPAIDILGGQAVRLKQGRKNEVTVYGDPIEMAAKWVRKGAEWLHIVDLDGAFEGKPKNLVTVPRTAVTYGLYGDNVWVVKEGPPEPEKTASVGDVAVPASTLTVERRFVRVGPSQGDEVAILEGVKAGEQVVTSGQLKLQPDATIKVDNSNALKAPAELPKQ